MPQELQGGEVSRQTITGLDNRTDSAGTCAPAAWPFPPSRPLEVGAFLQMSQEVRPKMPDSPEESVHCARLTTTPLVVVRANSPLTGRGKPVR